MIHRRFQVDQRLVAQLVDHAEQGLAADRWLRFLPSAKARTPSASQYDASTGMPSRMCSAAAPVHDGIEPRLQLPRSLARRDDEGGAAEARHSGLERGQGAQRRIEEHQPEDLARERARLRLVLQRLRERQQIEDLLAAEIGEIEKALHAEIFASASLS